MTDRTSILLEGRRERMERVLGRPLHTPATPGVPTLSPERRHFLRDEAEELYWNELEWENITKEERVDQGHLTELAFPGFLAFIRGLLLTQAMPDAGVEAEPRPEVVEDVLTFLAGRIVALEEEVQGGDSSEPEKAALALSLTSRLIDLVMAYLYRLSQDDVEALERQIEAG